MAHASARVLGGIFIYFWGVVKVGKKLLPPPFIEEEGSVQRLEPNTEKPNFQSRTLAIEFSDFVGGGAFAQVRSGRKC